jgi:hypothetical protein
MLLRGETRGGGMSLDVIGLGGGLLAVEVGEDAAFQLLLEPSPSS